MMKHYRDESAASSMAASSVTYVDDSVVKSVADSDDEVDFLTYNQLKRLQQNRKQRQQVCRIIVLAVSLGLLFALYLGYFYRNAIVQRNPMKLAPPKRLPRRALIMASYAQQDIKWTKDLSPDWEIYRYIMDDPRAKYHVPRNQGREAMAYTTFIIDHYNDLPDHMVFVHGHDMKWHSVEPTAWKVEGLNTTALEQDHYMSLRCTREPTANPARLVDLTKPVNRLGPMEPLMPWFWKLTNLSSTVPEKLAFPCCGQFAVSKEATLNRSLAWWQDFRDPLMRDIKDWDLKFGSMDDLYTDGLGLIYEKVWHVAFGKPPVYTPDESYCFREQWSDAVHCNRYLTAPFRGAPRDSMGAVKCYRNVKGSPPPEGESKPFEYKVWSACNLTDYKPDLSIPAWYSSDPAVLSNPRRHPCPGVGDAKGW